MRAWSIGWMFFIAACGGATQASAPVASPASPAVAAADVTRGAQLFGAKCSSCHGDQGQGTKKGPPLVGKDALPLDPRPGQKRTVQFHTALDVFNFVKSKMPADDPGSLSDEDYLAILAFDLNANGVDLKGKPLDATSATTIVLH